MAKGKEYKVTLSEEEVAHLKGVLLFHKDKTQTWLEENYNEQVPFISPQYLIQLDSKLVDKLTF